MNRLEIKQEVIANIGRDSTYLETQETSLNNYCNDALRIATNAHPFRDACAVSQLALVSESTTEFALPSNIEITHFLSLSVLYNGVSTVAYLRNPIWWSTRVIEPKENFTGRPFNCLRKTNTIIVDRPVESGTVLNIVYAYAPKFETDASVNPIKILDTYIVEYVTAKAFLRLENFESFTHWKRLALGYGYEQGKIGGTLHAAITADANDIGETVEMARVSDTAIANNGVSIADLSKAGSPITTWY